MKRHNGMRPHDIPVLLKIATRDGDDWYMKDLALELQISASEISESINRSVIAGLISSDKRNLRRLAILEFLEHGLKYVYPANLGNISRGIPTAHSAQPLNQEISSNHSYVWAYANGNIRGQTVQPLYPNLPKACIDFPRFHELMALTDALRIGKNRERNLAIEILNERLKNAK